MVVREQGSDLHLLSVVSPEWVQSGKVISVKRAPTDFGEVNFELRSDNFGATLILENHFLNSTRQSSDSTAQVQAPGSLVLHLPWFTKTSRAVADGIPLTVKHNAVNLPTSARKVRVTWTKRPDGAALSYSRAVEDYKAEYHRRYEIWQHSGQPIR